MRNQPDQALSIDTSAAAVSIAVAHAERQEELFQASLTLIVGGPQNTRKEDT